MANMTLLSDYSIGDTNFDAVMTTLDATRRVSFSLSNFDNTSAPVIEAGSIIDVGGALYEALTDVTISTTDPYTASTVADGVAYIVLQASGSPSTVSAAWTATAPVWRADYQGYYKTATVDRYIGGCVLSGTHTFYSGKYTYNTNSKLTVIENSDFVSTENTNATIGLLNCTNPVDVSLPVLAGDIIQVISYCEQKTDTGGVSRYQLFNSGTATYRILSNLSGSSEWNNYPAITVTSNTYYELQTSFYMVITGSGVLTLYDTLYNFGSGVTIYSKNRGVFIKKINTKQAVIS